jgi:hypothetical protein
MDDTNELPLSVLDLFSPKKLKQYEGLFDEVEGYEFDCQMAAFRLAQKTYPAYSVFTIVRNGEALLTFDGRQSVGNFDWFDLFRSMPRAFVRPASEAELEEMARGRELIAAIVESRTAVVN